METLKVFNEDGVLHVVLNRPEKRNAFNEQMIDEFIEVFSKDYNDIYAVLMYGEGKVFCAGADLNWMKKMGSATYEENFWSSMKMAQMFRLMYEFPLPIVSKVHGAVIGGGMGLVSVSDVVIAHEDTIFAWSEVKLGLVPAVVSYYSIRRVGESKAGRYFLTGERFSARRAYEIGFVDEVCGDDLDDKVRSILEELSQNGIYAMKLTKKLLRELKNQDDYMYYTSKVISDARASDEAQRRLSKFLKRR